MDQLTNYKLKIDSLISNDTSLVQPTQATIKPKCKRKMYKKCNECNRRRKTSNESHQICHVCYNAKTIIKQSGNKIIDDFIRYTQTNYVHKRGKMNFFPHDQFKNIEFIAEGGFSKIYRATWNYRTVVLKKLNNSKNITPKELNELKIFYNYRTIRWSCDNRVCSYFGITQDPNTQDFMIIMPYYSSGDLIHYINNDFYNIGWNVKLNNLSQIIDGLCDIHHIDIIHRDFHSGNIFFDNRKAIIGDLGISKSATESTDDENNENYGIIPYIAPEIFQGQKYTKASDIYSFGMIMWEFMTGRRPFWDEVHDIELIIKIIDGLRPPIATNAPKGYIELMKECWHFDPNKRPTAHNVWNNIREMYHKESGDNLTEIVPSPDIGSVTMKNPGAIYKSRPLSGMIKSAMSLRSSRDQSNDLEIDPFHYYRKNRESAGKRKFEDNLMEDNENNNDTDNEQSTKRKKLSENEKNNVFLTKEFELDIDSNYNHDINNEYITKEIELDINDL
ncbi:kinase-like domain-containing protein [Glomus cerebriforme]|uniref:Kinase-like domain-containing protein n=1 Tax=Glomus cerebriforme TaxID=658196 RepID=A0A397T8Y5_9GLOM|nr:kinase-like domain-containing protein [Glomus cerebriforme]